MAFRILIIEDVPGARGLLTAQLEIALLNRATFNGKWDTRWPSPETIIFDVDSIKEPDLQSLVRQQDDKEFSDSIDKLLAKYKFPNLIITDLALTSSDTNSLKTYGGREEEKKVKAHGWSNPLIVLPLITGFRILSAIVERGESDENFRTTAMVTTYANNPHIHKSCIEKGAFAVVQKVMSDDEMDIQWKHYHSRAKLTNKQIKEAEAGKPDIDKYIATIAIEAVKAFKDIALQLSYSHSPSPVPLWAAHQQVSLTPRSITKTNIILMDIRGFSTLVSIGAFKPQAVFNLMNLIWSQILEILKKYDAEINNFIGDAALVFRGVYQDPPIVAKLEDSLHCANELCNIFSMGGVVRKKLEDEIFNSFDSFAADESQRTQSIIEHINSTKFGLRIVVNSPDDDEALYGMVGIDGLRWQHTILSRFMNALARSESAVSKWEREGQFVDPVEAAHYFLLWEERRGLPKVKGFAFETPSIYLGKPREDIRDIPPRMEIYRVRTTAKKRLR